MSLEQAILENTDTMKELIKVWNTLAANASTAAANLKPGDNIIAAGVTIAKAAEPKPPVDLPPPPVKTSAKAPAPKSAAVSQPTETAAASPASKPEASSPAPSIVTYEDVKTLVLRVSKDKGRDTAAGVLAGFGVAKAPELKPEQYGDAVAQLQAALA